MRAGRRATDHYPEEPPVAGPASWLRGRLPDVAWILACVALALWVHRGTIGGYFSPDDLVYFERVLGLAEWPPPPWRFLSGPFYFGLLYPAFGAEPRPYLAINLGLHGLNVALLYLLVRGWGGGRPAAALAAGLFGTSRLSLTTLGQAVTAGELLALSFGLAAIGLGLRAGLKWRAAALAAFTAALLSKETVVLLPLLLVVPRPGGPPARERLVTAGLLALPAAALLLWLRTPAAHARIFADSAYESGYGVNLFHNLMTLGGWAVDLTNPLPDFVTTLSTRAWRTGLPLLAALAVLAGVAWKRSRLPALGALWFLLALAPVLPLLWQRYLHYLYLPIAGLAIAAGGALDALFSSAGRRGAGARAATASAIAAALIAGHAVISDRLLHERAERRFDYVDLRIDPFFHKQELLERSVSRVAAVTKRSPGNVAVVVPASGDAEPWGRRLRSMLGGGLALRAVVPGVDSATVTDGWTSVHRRGEVFFAPADGRLLALGRGPGAHARLIRILREQGLEAEARAFFDSAAATYGTGPLLDSLARSPLSPAP